MLLRHENFTVNATNELVTSKLLLCANDHVNMNQENDNDDENVNDADKTEDTMLNCVFFNANELKCLKVIYIANGTRVKVMEQDILNNYTIGCVLEFDK